MRKRNMSILTGLSAILALVGAISMTAAAPAHHRRVPHYHTLAAALRAHTKHTNRTVRASAAAQVLSTKFSVFAKEPAAADAMGTAATGVAGLAYAAQAHAISSSASAPAFATDWKLWVAPGVQADSICLLDLQPPAVGAGGGCGTTEQAAQGTLIQEIGSNQSHQIEIAGIMPDGVDHVTLTMADGTTQDIPVIDNVYRIDVTQPTRSVTFDLGNGPTTIAADSYNG